MLYVGGVGGRGLGHASSWNGHPAGPRDTQKLAVGSPDAQEACVCRL